MNKRTYLVVLLIVMLSSVASAHAAYVGKGIHACIVNLGANAAIGIALVLSMWAINSIAQRWLKNNKRARTVRFVREIGLVVLIVIWGAIYSQTVYTLGGDSIDLKTYSVIAVVGLLVASALI